MILHAIDHCYIGTDATGRAAAPNGLRGIAAISGAANVAIDNNIISGNTRSGIALWNVGEAVVRHNRIGVGVGGAALPNGASGVFVATDQYHVNIAKNTIGHNHDFGIGLLLGVHDVDATFNSIFDNGLLGVDWGLDGPSIAPGDNVPPTPRITEARYDPASNITTIRGIWSGTKPPYGYALIALFTNKSLNASGHAEAERLLATVSGSFGGKTFEGAARGDFRGQIITAQAVVHQFADYPVTAVSELSEGVRVE
jgi:parallel beta-helix repeat protein